MPFPLREEQAVEQKLIPGSCTSMVSNGEMLSTKYPMDTNTKRFKAEIGVKTSEI